MEQLGTIKNKNYTKAMTQASKFIERIFHLLEI
jgi:hypothetical protein